MKQFKKLSAFALACALATTSMTGLAAPTEVLQDETIVLEDITEKLQKTNIRFEVTKKIEFIHTTECIS